MPNLVAPVPVAPLQVSDAEKHNITNPIWTNWFTSVGLWLNRSPIASFGEGPPTTIPIKVNQQYADVTNKILYVAFGTTDVSDWVAVN